MMVMMDFWLGVVPGTGRHGMIMIMVIIRHIHFEFLQWSSSTRNVSDELSYDHYIAFINT